MPTTGYAGKGTALKIGDGASPEVFNAVGGGRTWDMQINNQPADLTNADSAGNRELLSAKVLQSVELSIEGVATNSTYLDDLEDAAIAGVAKNFQIVWPSGTTIEGPFIPTNFGRRGQHTDVEMFSCRLSSAGVCTKS